MGGYGEFSTEKSGYGWIWIRPNGVEWRISEFCPVKGLVISNLVCAIFPVFVRFILENVSGFYTNHLFWQTIPSIDDSMGEEITWPGRRFAVCSFDDIEAYFCDICDVSAPDTNASTLWNMWTCSSAGEFLFPVGKLREPTRGPSWRNRTSVKVKVMIRGTFTFCQNQRGFELLARRFSGQ